MGRWLGVLAAFLLVFLGSRAAFSAVGTLDQTGQGTNTSFNADTATLIWQQQIQVGLTGPLAGISVTATGKLSTQFNLRVRSGSAPSTQPVLFQQLVTVPATMASVTVFVDMTASGITFTAGNMFVMEIQGNATGAIIIGDYVAPPGTPGYPQPLYRNGSAYGAGFTLGFQTYVITCPTGASCDDGNPCTTNDTCDASYVCVGTQVVCTASDQCHSAGTCDLGTGLCSNPPQPDATPCNDSNACTQTDTCQAGTCVGSNPFVCTEAGMTDGGASTADGGGDPDGESTTDGGSAADGDGTPDGGSASDGGSAADGGGTADGGGAGEDGGVSEGGSGGTSDGGSAPEGGSDSAGGDGRSTAGGGGSSGGSAGSSGSSGSTGDSASAGGSGTAGSGAIYNDAGNVAGGSALAEESGGCGCVIATKAPSGAWVGLGVAIALAMRRRRRTGY